MMHLFSRAFRLIIILLALLSGGKAAFATHLRAGEIIVERENCQSLTFKITIIVYRDTESSVKFGDGILRLGDGSDPDGDGKAGFKLPEIDSYKKPGLGELVEIASYTFEHTYSAPGKYIISYLEPNRNADILNMDNSVNTRFYIEAGIIIDPFLGCNNSPVMLIPPIDRGCTGVAFFHNPGAYDPDGDSLSFELVVPKKEVGTQVDKYRQPNSSEFFNELPYLNENGTGQPQFFIDPVTGELTWDAPGDVKNKAGREYNVAFIVREWRKVHDEWFEVGYTTRDMQIIIEECDNKRPELIVPKDTCVVAGTLIDAKILGRDPDGDLVKIEAFSQIFNLGPHSASYTPNDGSLQSTLPPEDTANVRFKWQTDCINVRDQPFQVVFKITDRPLQGPKLVSFETWNITVIAPSPEITEAQTDYTSNGIRLNWEGYPCNNAGAIQVWRRVDSFNYVPGFCETGMPDFMGYELIEEVSPYDTTYLDNNEGKGLSAGATYCYRLVAVFPQPGGGESIISKEWCLEPIIADAPVITNVTVDRTDGANGQMTVSWMAPFDLDETVFGTDYSYEVQRAIGPIGGTYASLGKTNDTTFTDTGLNTLDNSYNYRIVLYSNNSSLVTPDQPVDTSATASSVWLYPRALKGQIELFWLAEVPWSNNSQDHPWHYIYRSPEGASEDQLTLIDSVNVNLYYFHYIDSGQYDNVPLKDTDVYCYYVITKGSYGNPKVFEPLLNKSQMICAQPMDDVPPCPPVITSEQIDCESFLEEASCEFNEFSNLIKWEPTTGGECQDDILYYEIYAVNNSESNNFQYLGLTRNTEYQDANLGSFARCYKVRAIDRSGNASEFSEVFCFDNCPYYELPNVFTPGNADGCNDFFSAFSGRNKLGENGENCGPIDETKCARFVETVRFSVYNRWGGLVYSYQSGGENTIYIDWDGRGNNGLEVSTGVYYYLAEVTFDVVDPSKKVREFKGWIEILK